MAVPGTVYLIVNADDLGQSRGVNDGIVKAHETGIVTSASLMVYGEAAAPAVSVAGGRSGLSIGLHLDFGEWLLRGGSWVALYERVPPDARIEMVQEEAERQLAMFRSLAGRDPTHLDSHQHLHREPHVAPVALELAERLGVPLRHFSPVRYCGAFYGQDDHGVQLPEAISVEALLDLLHSLSPGITELCCHPAERVEYQTSYAQERLLELESLCDPRVQETIAELGIVLCDFGACGRMFEAPKHRRHRR